MKEGSKKRKIKAAAKKAPGELTWALFDNSTEAVFIADPSGRVIYANAAFFQISAYLPSQITELSLTRLFPGSDLFQDVVGAQRPNHEHLGDVARPLQDKSGAILDVSVSALLLSDGSLFGKIKQPDNSTETKQKLEFLQTFINQAPVSIFRINRDAQILEVNAEACRSLGYAREELTQMTVFDLDSTFSQERWIEHRKKLKIEGSRVIESFHRRKDGSIFPVQITCQIFDGDNSYSVVQDISQRKQIEEALKQSEQRFRTLAQAAIEGIAISRDGAFLDLNEQLAKMLGYEREELINKPVLDYLAPEQRPLLEEMLDSGSTEAREFLAIHKNGTLIPIEVRFRPSLVDGQSVHINTILDITERKWAESALKESEFFLRKSQAVAGIGSYYLDAQTGIWKSSLALDEIFGVNAHHSKDIQGWLDLVHPQHKEEMSQYLSQHVLAEHNRFDKEYRIIRQNDGQERWVHGQGELEFDESGNTIAMIGTIQDITQSKRAELALRESESQLRLLTDNMVDMITLIDAQDKVVYVSPSIERIFGLPSSAYIGKPVTDWVHPDDLQRVVETGKRAITNKAPSVRMEYRSRHANGAYLWVESTTRLLYDEEGHSMGAILGSRDVTERKRVELLVSALNAAALAVRTARAPGEIFAAATEQLLKIGLSCAFFATDHQRRYLIPMYISYPGDVIATAERLTGLHLGSIMLPIEPVDVFRQTVWEGQPSYIENIVEATEQVLPRPVSILASLVVRHLGIKKSITMPLVVEKDVIGLFSVQSDDLRPGDVPILTAFAHQVAAAWRQAQLLVQAQNELGARIEAEGQVKHLNEELENRVVERTAQLEAAIDELEAFSYAVSHDLRAPLRVINGYTQIMLDDYQTTLDAEGKRICGVVLDETQHMSRLIDDLLAFSRVGREEMLSVWFDMRELVQMVYRELTKSANKSRIQITMKNLPQAMGDPKLIHQVWTNLLSNALKFTANRERTVIEIGSLPAEKESIYYIRDNGTGFEAEYARKLFGVFERLHTGSDYPGTGVGLAIVQRIIDRHGGRVWAEGEIGQSATFFFALPKKNSE